MKKTGIYRHVDALGRIVLPMEIRNALNIQTGDAIDISLVGEEIVLKQRIPSCIVCGTKENLERVNRKYICTECIKEIKSNH